MPTLSDWFMKYNVHLAEEVTCVGNEDIQLVEPDLSRRHMPAKKEALDDDNGDHEDHTTVEEVQGTSDEIVGVGNQANKGAHDAMLRQQPKSQAQTRLDTAALRRDLTAADELLGKPGSQADIGAVRVRLERALETLKETDTGFDQSTSGQINGSTLRKLSSATSSLITLMKPLIMGIRPSYRALWRGSEGNDGNDRTETVCSLQEARQSHARYFLDARQWLEMVYTARGLLKLTYPPLTRDVATEKIMIVQYGAEGGKFLLDRAVKDLSQHLTYDLIHLDAQDITELATLFVLSEQMLRDARLLPYDVYCSDPERLSTSTEEAELDEAEENDGESSPQGRQSAMPMLIGKPIAINVTGMLGQLFGNNRRGPSPTPSSFLSTPSSESQFKSDKALLTSLVQSVLSAVQTKRSEKKESFDNEAATIEKQERSDPQHHHSDGVIIHVKDMRAIQDVPFGKQFLEILQDGVQKERAMGNKMLIIGTEDSPDTRVASNRDSMQDILNGTATQEMSRKAFLSAIIANEHAKLALQQDKRRRIGRINLRNLFALMRHKNPDSFEALPDGFREMDHDEYLGSDGGQWLEDSVWTFNAVHRLTTILVGMRNDKEPLRASEITQGHDLITRNDNTRIAFGTSERLDVNLAQRWSTPARKTVRESRFERVRDSANKHEKRLLSGVVEPNQIHTTFRDVHVPVETIDTLQTITTLSLIRPEAFKYGVLASDRIPGLLLYGPPGTGKTMLAKAVAKDSSATVLEVSGAELNDMYVGESEKLVKALFSLAKKLPEPTIVFIDEVDALFSARGNNSRRVAHKEILNQFLKEWDGMSNDSRSAIIMVATNRPMDLDDAVLRRLPRRLLVDLPTEDDRLKILQIHLREERLDPDIDLADLARTTPFYSGSDLKNVAVAAALNAVREENEMAKSHRGEEPFSHAETRTLTARHFQKALEEISASISDDMDSLKEIKKFDEQYGDKRGKKRRPSWGFATPYDADKHLDTVKVRG